jgi:hypothetical protein
LKPVWQLLKKSNAGHISSVVEAFRPESGLRRLATVSPAFSLTGARAGGEQPSEGSTMISAAQLSGELMGRDRNLAPDQKLSNGR